MSHFAAVKRRTSISGGSAVSYDARFGTDLVTAAATGWFTFALHSGNRRIWLDSTKADDTGDGLTAATAKKTFNAAYTLWGTSFTAGDQLMIAGTGGRTYTASGQSNGLTGKAGISAAYPSAILSYDPADAANTAKYGKLSGSNKPVIQSPDWGAFASATGSGLADYIATQGLRFDAQDADGLGPTIQSRHDGIVFQYCDFNDLQLTLEYGSGYDATGASYGQTGNVSKCSFYGQWASGGNMQGIYLHCSKDFIIEDNVFAHVGWRIGSSRDDGAAGGANGVNHAHYVGASNTGVIVRRNFYTDTSADGMNLRGNGTVSSIASLDEPVVGYLGNFSGSWHEAPDGVTITADDWLMMGGAPINSGTPAGYGPQNINTLSGSYLRNVAAFDNPHPEPFIQSLNGGNSQNIVSITHSGTTATLTTDAAHGFTTGDKITVDFAAPTDYNVTRALVTVVNSTTLTYPMATTPATNATVVGKYTPIIPMFLLVDKVHAYNYSSSWESLSWVTTAIHNTYTNIISDQLAAGVGNAVSSGATFSGYKTRDQVVTAVLNGIGITPGSSYYARKAQLINAALTRPDLPWAQWLIGVGFPAMNLTPTYSTPAYTTFTDTPVSTYLTAPGNLTLSTLNFTHGVNSSALLSGVCANPVLTCADLPAGLTISGRTISGSATSAGTPTIHVVENSQDGTATPHTTAFTLNIS